MSGKINSVRNFLRTFVIHLWVWNVSEIGTKREIWQDVCYSIASKQLTLWCHRQRNPPRGRKPVLTLLAVAIVKANSKWYQVTYICFNEQYYTRAVMNSTLCLDRTYHISLKFVVPTCHLQKPEDTYVQVLCLHFGKKCLESWVDDVSLQLSSLFSSSAHQNCLSFGETLPSKWRKKEWFIYIAALLNPRGHMASHNSLEKLLFSSFHQNNPLVMWTILLNVFFQFRDSVK